ncbi:MAG: DUF1818 family protein [Cyanobacteria bacterium]|nr:DUF1818 family protein [Cyanobacteria bacterium bin.51]
MNPGCWSAEGEGWRLAWEPARQPFSVLIGGEGWAAELTTEEALQLRRVVTSLLEQREAIASGLMAEELISLECERDCCWMSIEGNRGEWSLRFVLSPGAWQRGIEGQWPPPASAAWAEALLALPL